MAQPSRGMASGSASTGNGTRTAKPRAPQGPKTLYLILDDAKLLEHNMTKATFLSCIEKTTTNGRVLVDLFTGDVPRQVVKFQITTSERTSPSAAVQAATDAGEHDTVSVS